MNNPKEIDINAFKAGDQQAFAHVVEKFTKLVMRRAWVFLREKQDVEDVTQDTFTELYKSRANFENEASIKGFLWQVVTNRCINFKAKKRLIPLEDLEESLLSPDELTIEMDRQGDLQDIDRYSQYLKPEMQDTLRYFYKEELPAEEIARLMNVAKSVVYYRLKAAKEAIRKRTRSQSIRIFISILFSIVCVFFLKKIFDAFGI